MPARPRAADGALRRAPRSARRPQAPTWRLNNAGGYAVTQVTLAQWQAMSSAQFKAYAALVIGDPSSGSCSSLTPVTGTARAGLTTLPSRSTGAYDHAGELTTSTLGGAITSYAYNADGQRLSAKQGSVTLASGTWNGASQLSGYTDSVATMNSATRRWTRMATPTATRSVRPIRAAQPVVGQTNVRHPRMTTPDLTRPAGLTGSLLHVCGTGSRRPMTLSSQRWPGKAIATAGSRQFNL